MMMFDYKGGRGVKNLEKSDYVICERSLKNMFRLIKMQTHLSILLQTKCAAWMIFFDVDTSFSTKTLVNSKTIYAFKQRLIKIANSDAEIDSLESSFP